MTWTEIKMLVERPRRVTGRLRRTDERFQPTVYAVALARLRNPTEARNWRRKCSCTA